MYISYGMVFKHSRDICGMYSTPTGFSIFFIDLPDLRIYYQEFIIGWSLLFKSNLAELKEHSGIYKSINLHILEDFVEKIFEACIHKLLYITCINFVTKICKTIYETLTYVINCITKSPECK